MASFERDGVRIHFEDSGGDGPVILWSHGFLMDHTMFDPQVAGLPGYRHIRWDERGFGRTAATGPFTYWDAAEDAIGLLDHLGIDQAVLAGMSQGGFLSLRAALAHPERVRALILIDTQSGTEDPAVMESYQEMVVALSQGDEATRSAVYDVVGGLILGDPDLEREWKQRWMEREPATIVDPGGALLGRDDITDRIGEIRCPALIVHGTADAAIPIEKAELLRAGLGDCRDLVPIEGAAHAPNLSHPDEVNRHVARFLDAI